MTLVQSLKTKGARVEEEAAVVARIILPNSKDSFLKRRYNNGKGMGA